MILKIIEMWFFVLGIIATMILTMVFASWIYDKIAEIMHRQSKIRCLCKHEYVRYSIFKSKTHAECEFHCRKCGKIIKINVYEDDE